MKITPIHAGGTNLGNIGLAGPSAGADKVAAAKAAFLGEQAPVTITQSDSYVDPQVRRAQETIRKIKMKTNASPEQYDTAPEAPLDAAAPQDGPILDDSGQVNATTEDTKPLSPQFAALARQKRALQVKERELADREKALVESQPKIGQDEIVARLKSQPLSVLQEYGVTYDQLTEAILANQGGNSEMAQLKAELQALKEGMEKLPTTMEENQKQAALSEMRREAESLVKEGDAYEMVRVTGSLPQAIELIDRTYTQTGEVLDVSEALQLVEDKLIEKNLTLARSKKILSQLQTQDQAQTQPQVKGMRTLTNRDNARPTLDKKARARAAFRGEKQ